MCCVDAEEGAGCRLAAGGGGTRGRCRRNDDSSKDNYKGFKDRIHAHVSVVFSFIVCSVVQEAQLCGASQMK